MSVKSKIEQLSIQERRQLAHAFDCGISQYIIITDTNKFVGVHLDSKRIKHLNILEQTGVWCHGIVKNN